MNRSIIILLGMFFVAVILNSCTTKSYYVRNGKLQPYNERGIAANQVMFEHDGVRYYFDNTKDAERYRNYLNNKDSLSSTVRNDNN